MNDPTDKENTASPKEPGLNMPQTDNTDAKNVDSTEKVIKVWIATSICNGGNLSQH
jgi:hypothetical protein